jgi:hypothetical protein
MVDSIFDWFCCTILAFCLARFCNCIITWKLMMQFCFKLAKGHHQAKQVDNVHIGSSMTSTSILSNKWPCCNFDATYNITTIYPKKRIKCMVLCMIPTCVGEKKTWELTIGTKLWDLWIGFYFVISTCYVLYHVHNYLLGLKAWITYSPQYVSMDFHDIHMPSLALSHM